MIRTSLEGFPYNHHHLGWATGGLVAILCPGIKGRLTQRFKPRKLDACLFFFFSGDQRHQQTIGSWWSTRWAPASYNKWSYNPHKWPYKLGRWGYDPYKWSYRLLLITGRGPLTDSDTSKLWLDSSNDVGKIYRLVLTTINQPFMYVGAYICDILYDSNPADLFFGKGSPSNLI